MTSINIVEFSGTHREIGQAHGEEFRDKIHELVSYVEQSVSLRARIRPDSTSLYSLLRKHWAYSVEYAPELEDEIVGIAKGAHLPVDAIILINAFLDLVSVRDDRVAASLFGCTSFGVLPETTLNSKCYIGQNYEMEAFYKDHIILAKVKPIGSPATLIYTYTGVVGCAGMNEEGIGLCINFLHARDAAYGILYPLTVRKILKQVRIGDAVGAATIGYKAGGLNLLVASGEGFIFSVETSARDHDVLVPVNGIIAHSNHYLSPHMRQYDLVLWDQTYDSAITRRGSSLVRWHAATRMLEINRGKIDVPLLIALTRNQENHPYAICCFGNPSDDDMHRGETNASMIFDLSAREMHFCAGNPLHNEFAVFSL